MNERDRQKRRADARHYMMLNPEGEAKTIRVGFMKVPFWRCRPLKGQGPWSALPSYDEEEMKQPQMASEPPATAKMTPEERRAVVALGEAWNAICEALPDPQDRKDAGDAIHAAQRLILSQATIRSEPELLRQR